MTTTAASVISIRTHARLLVGAGLAAAAIAVGAGPLGSIAVANADYNKAWFEWCTNRPSGEVTDVGYCCEHAGGVMRDGKCINPEDLRAPNVSVLDPGPSGPVVNPWRPEVTGPLEAVNDPGPVIRQPRPEVLTPSVGGIWTSAG